MNIQNLFVQKLFKGGNYSRKYGIHSRILHFVTVVFGRNSFISQRSLSTHIKLFHTIEKPFLWDLKTQVLNIHSRILHFVTDMPIHWLSVIMPLRKFWQTTENWLKTHQDKDKGTEYVLQPYILSIKYRGVSDGWAEQAIAHPTKITTLFMPLMFYVLLQNKVVTALAIL